MAETLSATFLTITVFPRKFAHFKLRNGLGDIVE